MRFHGHPITSENKKGRRTKGQKEGRKRIKRKKDNVFGENASIGA